MTLSVRVNNAHAALCWNSL